MAMTQNYSLMTATQMQIDDDEYTATPWCASSVGGHGGPTGPAIVRKKSMDLVNDPRFFTPNVIDKRLSAFTALSIVCGIMAGAAVDQCFGLKKDFELFGSTWLFGWIHFVGFGFMCMVLAMNVFTTLIFGLQLFFTFRLMTAGPAGFESAKAFYLDSHTTYWRQLSAHYLIKGMPLFLWSVGMMLFTKIRVENTTDSFHIVAWLSLVFFSFTAALLLHVGNQHQRAFDDKYHVGHETLRPLVTAMQTRSHHDEVSVLC